MTETLSVHSDTTLAAASVLVDALPTTARLNARVADASREAPRDAWVTENGVVATFVGSRSYDLALAIRPDLLPRGNQDGQLSLVDLLQTALNDASARFGEGVLTGVHADDATPLLGDADTVVVELVDGDATAGVFAVRARSAGGIRSVSDDDVSGRLSRISGVEMELTVQIGRTRMSVRDVLGLEAGAIVELDRSAGSPADILLNGRLIAHGEVVVVDQDYAVRITSIIDAADTAL